MKQVSITRRAQRSQTRTLLVLAIFCLLAQTASAQSTGLTGLFGGGPFYKTASANITQVENSGFTEAVVWSVEVNPAGDLDFNGEFPLTSGGLYVGNQTWPNFPADMAQLKQGTVKRVTFSIGSSNYGDWENIKALVDSQGTGPTSILYKDFQALKAAIPALDAIDMDDENSYDAPSTVAFAVMLGKMGFKTIPDPYTNNAYWESVVTQINTQLPGTVDGVHLQAYSGGAGNNPCAGWNFGSVPVWPGLWDQVDTPAQVQTIMTGWNKECGINGGTLWLYDDIVGSPLVNQYAAAINAATAPREFTLSGTRAVYLDQSSTAHAIVKITDVDGFAGPVALTVSGLPKGVLAIVEGTANVQEIVFKASAIAPTGTSTVTVTGTAGTFTQTLPITFNVNAGIGSTGVGTPVDLSPAYNLIGIFEDGTVYSSPGLDGQGDAYSANLLGATRVLNTALFQFGPVGQLDAVGSSGQKISLPAGSFGSIRILGTGIDGNQSAQPFTVIYTDKTYATFSQNLSDWYTPQHFPGELPAAAMPYRDEAPGAKDSRVFNLYGYVFRLDSTKTVESLILPVNTNVVVLAATLTN